MPCWGGGGEGGTGASPPPHVFLLFLHLYFNVFVFVYLFIIIIIFFFFFFFFILFFFFFFFFYTLNLNPFPASCLYEFSRTAGETPLGVGLVFYSLPFVLTSWVLGLAGMTGYLYEHTCTYLFVEAFVAYVNW